MDYQITRSALQIHLFARSISRNQMFTFRCTGWKACMLTSTTFRPSHRDSFRRRHRSGPRGRGEGRSRAGGDASQAGSLRWRPRQVPRCQCPRRRRCEIHSSYSIFGRPFALWNTSKSHDNSRTGWHWALIDLLCFLSTVNNAHSNIRVFFGTEFDFHDLGYEV